MVSDVFLLLLLLLRRTNVIETIALVIASNSWIVRLQRPPPPTHPTTIVVTQTTYFIHSFLSFLIYGNSIEFRNYRMQTLNIVLIPKGEREKREHIVHIHVLDNDVIAVAVAVFTWKQSFGYSNVMVFFLLLIACLFAHVRYASRIAGFTLTFFFSYVWVCEYAS